MENILTENQRFGKREKNQWKILQTGNKQEKEREKERERESRIELQEEKIREEEHSKSS